MYKKFIFLCAKLNLKDRGGYGRPKFELRSLPAIIWTGARPTRLPNYPHYISIFNALARPAILTPLPPNIPAEHQHRVFPAASVDSRRPGTLHGGSILERQEFHSIWLPGIPGYEHGRRAPERVTEWIDEQDALQAAAQKDISIAAQTDIRAKLDSVNLFTSQQKYYIDDLNQILLEVRRMPAHDVRLSKKKLQALEINMKIENLNITIQNFLPEIDAISKRLHDAASAGRTFARFPLGTLRSAQNRNIAISAAARAEAAYNEVKRILSFLQGRAQESLRSVENSRQITAQINTLITKIF